MKVLRLLRVTENQYGTFGVLMDRDDKGDWLPFCVTLEPRWLNNERGKSCMPLGEFMMKSCVYNKGGYKTYEIICPPRELVKVHKGNLFEDTHGCLLTGEQYEPVWDTDNNEWGYGILKSGKAFKEFMVRLDGQVEAKLLVEKA